MEGGGVEEEEEEGDGELSRNWGWSNVKVIEDRKVK